MRFAALALIVCMASPARAYDFTMHGFAIEAGGTFGSSNAGDGAFALSSGAGTKTDHKVQTALSGSLALMYAGARANFKLGCEYFLPKDQAGVTGTNASGQNLFSLHSGLSAFIPEATLELQALRDIDSHLLVGIGYGLALVSLQNDYTMTSAGQTALGKSSYSEQASATASMFQAYVGYEFAFADRATIALNLGYRYLMVPGFKATQNAAAITGNETSGAAIVNNDGSARVLNLGGAFASLGIRLHF